MELHYRQRSLPDAERAFRRYAAYGLDRRRLSAFEIYDAIRGISLNYPDALNMLAVYDTLRLLHLSGQSDSAEALRAVYFAGVGRYPKRNDITYRVLRFAFENNLDERTVYRRLNRAKEIYRALRRNADNSAAF